MIRFADGHKPRRSSDYDRGESDHVPHQEPLSVPLNVAKFNTLIMETAALQLQAEAFFGDVTLAKEVVRHQYSLHHDTRANLLYILAHPLSFQSDAVSKTQIEKVMDAIAPNWRKDMR